MSIAASHSTLGNITYDTQHFIQDASVQPIHCSSVIAQICLPGPPPLYPSLITIGADERVAREMDRAYNARALELRSYYESSIRNAFAALADFPFPDGSEKRILDTFSSLYLTKVKSWIEDGVAAYKGSLNLAKQASSDDVVSRKTNAQRAFNTDYVPLLEHFFEENPFPTHADKAFLAKKSGMTYRQIHVWFQNRRNRTKKPNGTWRKKPACEGVTHPLDNLCKRMGRYIVHNEQTSCPPLETPRSSHSDDRKLMQSKRSSETVSRRMAPQAEDSNVLDRCTAPLHAFPSTYPPVCVHQPFPLESHDQMLLAVQWRRRPNHNTSLQAHKTDVNDLVERFALLSVRDTYPRRSQRVCREMRNSLSATYSITTVPPPAPHPALVKPMNVVSSFPLPSSFPIVRAPQPTSQVFMESIPIPPPSHSKNDISSRKVYPLPKRHLQSCRSVTPATSDEPSSTPSPCSSLRSLSNSFDSRREARSPGPCPGSLVPRPLSPQLQTGQATQEPASDSSTLAKPRP